MKNVKNKEIEPYNNIYLGMHATFSSSAEMLTLKCLLFLKWDFGKLGVFVEFLSPPLLQTNNNHHYGTQVTTRYHCCTFSAI